MSKTNAHKDNDLSKKNAVILEMMQYNEAERHNSIYMRCWSTTF